MLKSPIKNIYFTLLYLLRHDIRLLEQIKQEDLLVVLNFHQISPHVNPFWQPLHPDLFDNLLGFLKEHFQIVLFRDLDLASKDRPLAILSFDDGYYNFVEYALPILKKHKLRVNMNIIPAVVESGVPPWNILLYDFLNAASLSLINEICLPGLNLKLINEKFESKVRYGLQISRFLIDRPRNERTIMWETIQLVMAKMDFTTTRVMNIEEVKSINKEHEIGAHSFSHESMLFEDDDFFYKRLTPLF